jgi:tRNA nucleotidyltransferase/poly(A) polymerase
MKREHRKKSEGRRESAFSFVLKREPLVKQIYALSRELGVRVYLVGGVMRNLALDLPLPLPSDYDLAVEGDVKGFVEKLAGTVGGSFFILDEESETWRVVKKGAYTVDCAPLKGPDISADLAVRDFTVNALAAGLDEIFTTGKAFLIDPFGGLKDGEEKVLRTVYARAFDDDPLRVVRAVRISQQFALKITHETRDLAKRKAPLLARTAKERIRDELMLMFECLGTEGGLRKLFDFSIAETILPETCCWGDVDGYNLLDHSLKTLAEAEAIVRGPFLSRFPWLKEHGQLKEVSRF